MNRASHKDPAQNSVWDSLGPILEVAGTFLGASWGLLGWLGGALGRLLVPLGRFLGDSWALLGRSWAFLGRLEPPFGWILTPREAPDLNFKGFGDAQNWFWRALGTCFGMPFAAPRTS